jgi:hypothetical protein
VFAKGILMKVILAAATVLMLAAPAQAITVNETTDFSANLNAPISVGTLGIGSNSISGSVSAKCQLVADFSLDCTSYDGDPGDAFEFDIAAGTELTDGTLTIFDLSTDGSGRARVFARSFEQLTDLARVEDGVFDIVTGGPLTGMQNFQVQPRLLLASLDDSISFDWRVDLTVAEINDQATVVPLPAGLPLVLTALAGFAGLRLRKGRKGEA